MRPELKVLLTSGYSDVPLAASEAVRAIKVLGKPYTRQQLACALRETFIKRRLRTVALSCVFIEMEARCLLRPNPTLSCLTTSS